LKGKNQWFNRLFVHWMNQINGFPKQYIEPNKITMIVSIYFNHHSLQTGFFHDIVHYFSFFFSMAFGCWRRTISSDDEMHGSVGQASDQSYMRNQVESVSQ